MKISDWIDWIGEHIDKIEWDKDCQRWEISNNLLKVHATPLGSALDKFQREWSAMNL